MQFSIVITCHNQCRFIRQAVESALAQRLAGAEILIVDDGSSDGSREILLEYETRARLLLLPVNQGAIAARNIGAASAGGDYLVFLDGDDALMPWALQVYARVIEASSPMLILGRRQWCEGSIPEAAGETPAEIECVTYETPMLKDRSIGLGASTFVVLRREFEAVGGWTPGIFHLDLQDLVTKLAYSGAMTLMVRPYTAFYRIHSTNSIHTVPPFLRSIHRLIQKEKTGEYPGGRARRFERRAWLGGLVVYWIRRAIAAGLYVDAMVLACRGWSMVVAGVARKSALWIGGRRRPAYKIEL